MNPYGDGSDGALNVTSGVRNLPLNVKHQFTSVNISLGAILSTSSTTGSVLYICATESVVINGTIDLKDKVNPGKFTWPVTIDGTSYVSPGAAGIAGHGNGGPGSGFSGYPGGAGGSAGTPISGGASVTAFRQTSGGSTGSAGNPGERSGGGSGGAVSVIANNAGGRPYANSVSGAGGNAYGSNGGNGSGNGGTDPGWTGGWSWNAGGGGGAGGLSGRAGVHLVINAPSIEINGTIITSGGNAGNGGNGGRAYTHTGPSSLYGIGGTGGSGGNAGRVNLNYGLSIDDNGQYLFSGGAPGLGGFGNTNQSSQSAQGTPGTASSKSTQSIAPFASFIADMTSGERPFTVNFENKSIGAVSYLWEFGDGSTSTASSPTKTYSQIGVYSVKLTATNSSGSSESVRSDYITVTKATYNISISGGFKMGGSVNRKAIYKKAISGGFKMGGDITAIRRGDTANIQRKTFLYKVYDELGNFQGILDDVISNLSFTKEINTPGSSIEIELARNSDSRDTERQNRTTVSGANRTVVSGQTRTVSTETRAKVGPGSDLVHNNRVDIWIYYGMTANRTTVDGRDRTTVDGANRTVDVGYPNGRKKFSGFISQINTRYGSTETTSVTLMSYGYDLDQYLYDTPSGATTVVQNSVDPSTMVKNALDRFAAVGIGTYTKYSPISISPTLSVASYTYRANTYLEVIEKSLELSPTNWYWHADLGSNDIFFRKRQETATHTFFLGLHISSLNLRSSIEDTVNDVLFTGGEVTSGSTTSQLYRRYTRTPAPYTRRGLNRLSDGRVTLTSSADILAEGNIAENNSIQYKTSITILDGTYDIERIEVGDTVGYRNFGVPWIDSLVMQIVGLTYNPSSITLQLDTLSPAVPKRLQDLRRNQDNEATTTVPDSPVVV